MKLNTKNKIIKKYEIVFLFIIIFLATGSSLLLPFITRDIINLLIGGVELYVLVYNILKALFIILISMLLCHMQNFFSKRIISRYNYRLKENLIEVLLNKNSVNPNQIEKILYVIFNDTSIISARLCFFKINILVGVLYLVIINALVWVVDIRMLIILDIIVVVECIINYFVQKKIKPIVNSVHKSGEKTYAQTREVLSNIEIIKMSSMEAEEVEKLGGEYKEYSNTFFLNNYLTGTVNIFLSLLGMIWTICILLIGGQEVLNGHSNIGDIIFLITALGIITSVSTSIMDSILNYPILKLAIDKCNAILEIDFNNGLVLHGNKKFCTGNIKCENLRFSYLNSNRYVINNLNIELLAGRRNYIVGKSGIGKTTLLKLLSRQIVGYSGKILVSKNEYSEIDEEEFKGKIWYVESKSKFFSGTIFDNITYGCSEEENVLEKVNEALAQAEIFEKVEKLPLGIYTRIENNFSDGELQRLALARGFFRKPKILLLDEATSNIDVATEKKVISKLPLFSDQIVVIVTHRKINCFNEEDNVLNLEFSENERI